jgi:hypothetical protein
MANNTGTLFEAVSIQLYMTYISLFYSCTNSPLNANEDPPCLCCFP